MQPTIFSVSFDCADPKELATFWAEALGYELRVRADGDNEDAAVRPFDGSGPLMLFHRVPEPKATKNRVHLDLDATDRVEAEVERLTNLGARPTERHSDGDVWWQTMLDPGGNEFCVCHIPR